MTAIVRCFAICDVQFMRFFWSGECLDRFHGWYLDNLVLSPGQSSKASAAKGEMAWRPRQPLGPDQRGPTTRYRVAALRDQGRCYGRCQESGQHGDSLQRAIPRHGQSDQLHNEMLRILPLLVALPTSSLLSLVSS